MSWDQGAIWNSDVEDDAPLLGVDSDALDMTKAGLQVGGEESKPQPPLNRVLMSFSGELSQLSHDPSEGL